MTNPYLADAALVTARDVLDTPEPDWLIEHHIHQQEIGFIWGPPGCGKTFVALDWALSVATGQSWLGTYKTAQGPVLYLAGEGAASLQKRIDAWMDFHGVTEVPGAYFITKALPLREPEAIEAIHENLKCFQESEDDEPGDIQPQLIVIDTLSQFFGSGDEIGPEMRDFVQAVRKISQDANCAVVIVHHSNAAGDRERGHSALRCNSDVVFEVESSERDGTLHTVKVKNDKQRDDKKNPPVSLSVRQAGRGLKKSLVVLLGNSKNVSQESQDDILRQLKKPLVKMLIAFETFEDVSREKSHHVEIQNALRLTKPTLHRYLTTLKEFRLISSASAGYSKLTLTGREVIERSLKTRNETHETTSQSLTLAPSLRGATGNETVVKPGGKKGSVKAQKAPIGTQVIAALKDGALSPAELQQVVPAVTEECLRQLVALEIVSFKKEKLALETMR